MACGPYQNRNPVTVRSGAQNSIMMMATTESINENIKPSDLPPAKYNGVLEAYAPQAERPCNTAAIAADRDPLHIEVGATLLASTGQVGEKKR